MSVTLNTDTYRAERGVGTKEKVFEVFNPKNPPCADFLSWKSVLFTNSNVLLSWVEIKNRLKMDRKEIDELYKQIPKKDKREIRERAKIMNCKTEKEIREYVVGAREFRQREGNEHESEK
ncbi:MAG: hypothetical protein Q7S12_03770 [bacterium]|nr:hypothetical protein [bacterium]